MKLVLASDLDGTLIRDNIVPNYNIESLKKLKSCGGMFVVATGRPHNGVSYLVESYNLDLDYSILLNGALILDKGNNVILHKTLSYNNIKNIVSHVENFNPHISIETGFTTYLLKKDHSSLPYPKKVIIDSIDHLHTEDISLISLYFGDMPLDEINKICISINENFSSKCVAFRNVNFIDVVPKNCSKGEAISYLCNLENIDCENLYTIGDSFNDVSMFNITNNSFTFHECEESLKFYASNIVNSVSECIEEYIL